MLTRSVLFQQQPMALRLPPPASQALLLTQGGGAMLRRPARQVRLIACGAASHGARLAISARHMMEFWVFYGIPSQRAEIADHLRHFGDLPRPLLPRRGRLAGGHI